MRIAWSWEPLELEPVAAIAGHVAQTLIIDELAVRDAHLEPERQVHRGVIVVLAVNVEGVTRAEHARLRRIVRLLGRMEREAVVPRGVEQPRLRARRRREVD